VHSYVIGRKDSDLCLKDDMKISKQHLCLERKGKDLVLRDLGSSNGTYFNDERITEKVLSVNDEVRVGAHIIKILSIDYGATAKEEKKEPGFKEPDPNLDTFLFLSGGKLSFSGIKDTYLLAAKNVKTFWQTVFLDIPVKTSTLVLVFTSIGYTAAADGIAWGRMSASFILGFFLLAISCPLVLAAVFSEFDDWHKAQGSFPEYAAFTAYWYFLFLPFALLFPFIGGFGAIAALVFLIWGTLAFEKRFKPERSRFVPLLVGFYLGSFFLFGSLLFKLFAKRT
jgi:hypothetical protein